MKMPSINRGLYRWIAVVALATGCGDSPVDLPVEPDDPPEPVVVPTIAIVSGNLQTGLAGQFLPEPFIVKVTDESG